MLISSTAGTRLSTVAPINHGSDADNDWGETRLLGSNGAAVSAARVVDPDSTNRPSKISPTATTSKRLQAIVFMFAPP